MSEAEKIIKWFKTKTAEHVSDQTGEREKLSKAFESEGKFESWKSLREKLKIERKNLRENAVKKQQKILL